MPPFPYDVEQFLESFQNAMELRKFSRDRWFVLMHTKLTGKAQRDFSESSIEECNDYDTLKKALLMAYAMVPEFYRKQFRTMQKGQWKTYANYALRMCTSFKAWLDGEQA